MNRICACLCITVLSLFLASTVDAAIVHPNVSGTTVDFTNIEEDSPSGDPLPLFGPPSHAGGNSIDFNTTGNFSAHSTNGGADITDGKLNLMIRAKQGHTVEALHILETGLVSLFTMGVDDPFAAVTGLLDLDVVEIDGIPVGQINLPLFNLTYTPSNGDFLHSADATGPLYSEGWSGALTVDIDAQLSALQIPYVYGATKVNLTLNNRLLASTGALGSIAIIDKKDFDITVDTDPIPEPATAILVLAAAAAVPFAWSRRRG